MTEQQITQFRKDFKQIIYQRGLLSQSYKYIIKLCQYDKNGSHDNAINKARKEKDEIKQKLLLMMDGMDYEDWKLTSKRLSVLCSKLKTIAATKLKIENEISKLPILPSNTK